MSEKNTAQERSQRFFHSGIGWGLAVNLLAGFALLAYSLFITIGIGLSGDHEQGWQAVQNVTALWLAAPILFNLPGLAYAYFVRSKRFLAGWGLGLLAALLLAGGTMGCIWLYIAILRASV